MSFEPYLELARGSGRLTPLLVEWWARCGHDIQAVMACEHRLAYGITDGLATITPFWRQAVQEDRVEEIARFKDFHAVLPVRVDVLVVDNDENEPLTADFATLGVRVEKVSYAGTRSRYVTVTSFENPAPFGVWRLRQLGIITHTHHVVLPTGHVCAYPDYESEIPGELLARPWVQARLPINAMEDA